MSPGHSELPALDVDQEQREIAALIESLKNFVPHSKGNSETCSSNSSSSTPKSVSSKPGRGRPSKNREVLSSPTLAAASCWSGFDLVIDCLTKLNTQNERLINRVSELDSVIQEQNRTIESLKIKVESHIEKDSSSSPSPSDDHPIVVPPAPSDHRELLQTVVERVEKIEVNINSHFLLCRGPAVSSKIAASTDDGFVNLDKIKAELCSEICGENISKIGVSTVGISIFGRRKNVLKVECSNTSVRNYLLEQARKRKPVGVYLVEFLSPEKNSLYQRVNAFKREFPSIVKAVFVRKGDIFCKTDPHDNVIKVSTSKDADDLRSKLVGVPEVGGDDGAIAE